ncbi:MAG: hypothetical protein ACI8ZM_001769 [Crocinitomix sp.]|jgi:hypothetical protein
MKLKTACLITLLYSAFCLNAQLQIKGDLVDDNNAPVLFGNVLAVSKLDSSLIAGVYAENGSFELKVDEKEVLLKVSAINYEPKWIEIIESIDLGAIIMKPVLLEEVEVIARTLPFENKNGNMVINVDNTIFSSSTSPLEILSKSPGVIVSGNEVSIIGRGEAQVYINNRRSTIEALNALPVSQIKSIEIIRNPDASYEAEGKAVILIKTKELGIEGYQAKILGHYTKAFYQLGYFDASINWHKKKFTISASGNTNLGSTGIIRLDQLQVSNANEPYDAETDYLEKTKLYPVINYLFGVKYQLSPKQSISAEYNGNYSIYELDVETNIKQRFYDGTAREIKSNLDAKSLWRTDILSANYTLETDTLGGRLFIGATYSSVFKGYDDRVNEVTSINDGVFNAQTLSIGENLNALKNAQIDFSKEFKNGNNFKIGSKLSNVISESDLSLNTVSSDSSYNNIQNNLKYNENLIAGYFNWNGTFKKGNYQLGVRFENTTATAYEGQDQNGYLDTNYLSVFPNARITNTLKGNWSMSDKFNSKIARPRFQDITPYIYYLNAFTAVRGNPNVKPSFIYNFEHSFDNQKFASSFRIGVNHTKGPRIFSLFLTDSLETDNTLQIVNFKQENEAYFEIGQGFEIKKITGYAMLNVSISKLEADNISFEEMPITPKVYFYLYAKIPVKNWFNFEIIGDIQSKFFDGRRTVLPTGSINFALSKSFMNNKFYAQLDINDMLQLSKQRIDLIQDNNAYQAQITQDNRFLRFTLRYKFGKLKQSNYNHLNINANELNRAN